VILRAAALVAMLATSARADGVSLDARIAPQWIFLEGDGPPADLTGDMIGVNVAYPLGHQIALAGEFEAALYTQRSDRMPPGGSAHDLDTFVELQIDTDPTARFTARIALGTGVRWLSLPLSAGPTDHFVAWEPLRLRAGPAWRTSERTQIAVMAGLGFGFMMSRTRDGACAVTASCADSLYDSDSQSSAHFVVELALVVHGWR
jgi:hypothetical protein